MAIAINLEAIETQIREKQKEIDFDLKQFTLEHIIQKYSNGLEIGENEIYIPSYQREFIWDEERQSKFIESVILGLPIPFLFAAEIDEDGRLEIIDGSQRIRTIEAYFIDKLKLKHLDVLTELKETFFSDLPPSRQKKIKNTTIRMIVLDASSTEDARIMLFDRINTGSVSLNNTEVRRGANQKNPFMQFIKELADSSLYRSLTRFTKYAVKRREPEELVLRFFAYSEKYQSYRGNLNNFLNEYTKEMEIKFAEEEFDSKPYREKFEQMLNYTKTMLPNGFSRENEPNSTSRGRFEAISVGIILALDEKPDLAVQNVSWLNSADFEREISGGSTNTSKKVKSRIDFVKNKLLGK